MLYIDSIFITIIYGCINLTFTVLPLHMRNNISEMDYTDVKNTYDIRDFFVTIKKCPHVLSSNGSIPSARTHRLMSSAPVDSKQLQEVMFLVSRRCSASLTPECHHTSCGCFDPGDPMIWCSAKRKIERLKKGK